MFRIHKKIHRFLERTYKKLDKNTFIIEIDLNRYLEVFNEWDKATVRRRDIDPQLENFLIQCSSDIPLKYNIALYFYLPASVKNEKTEQIVIEALQNYFNFCILNSMKAKRKFFNKTFKYLLMSLLFLSAAAMMKIKITNNFILETLTEVIFIGGWVFMWETFSNLFIFQEDLHREDKEFNRFLNSEIIFKYEEDK